MKNSELKSKMDADKCKGLNEKNYKIWNSPSFIGKKYLNEDQLKNIKQHKYNGNGYTKLESYVDNFIFDPLSKYVPEV